MFVKICDHDKPNFLVNYNYYPKEKKQKIRETLIKIAEEIPTAAKIMIYLLKPAL